MDKLTIFKNKGETFRCQFKIEGASVKDTSVRLCLEFDEENKHLFFHGTLSDSGECVIDIPRLKEIKAGSAKLTVEAIADGIYFKLYEANAELRNSVEVSMEKPKARKPQCTKVELEGLSQERVEPAREPPVVEETAEEDTEEVAEETSQSNGFCPRRHVKPIVLSEDRSPISNFRSFGEYLHKTRDGQHK
jgi:hypothetical protein